MGLSARAMRRYRIFKTQGYYISIIYTPNLELAIIVFDQEREQGRFRESNEGARESNEGARGSIEGALREQRGSKGEHCGAVQERSRWEPKLAALYSTIVARIIYDVCQHYCLA